MRATPAPSLGEPLKQSRPDMCGYYLLGEARSGKVRKLTDFEKAQLALGALTVIAAFIQAFRT